MTNATNTTTLAKQVDAWRRAIGRLQRLQSLVALATGVVAPDPAAQAIRPLRTNEDHAAALAEVQALIAHTPKPGTPEGDRLDVLAVLVEAYEIAHFPLPAAPARACRWCNEPDTTKRDCIAPDQFGHDFRQQK